LKSGIRGREKGFCLTPGRPLRRPPEKWNRKFYCPSKKGQKVLRRQLLRRVFYGIKNALEGAERSIQSDIRFMPRTVLQENLLDFLVKRILYFVLEIAVIVST